MLWSLITAYWRVSRCCCRRGRYHLNCKFIKGLFYNCHSPLIWGYLYVQLWYKTPYRNGNNFLPCGVRLLCWVFFPLFLICDWDLISSYCATFSTPSCQVRCIFSLLLGPYARNSETLFVSLSDGILSIFLQISFNIYSLQLSWGNLFISRLHYFYSCLSVSTFRYYTAVLHF